MEKKFLILLLVLTSRHLQDSTNLKVFIQYKPRKLIFKSFDQSLLCDLQFSQVHVYKSRYCFKKRRSEKQLSFSYVLSPSKKQKTPQKKDNRAVVFFSIKNWDKIYFSQ